MKKLNVFLICLIIAGCNSNAPDTSADIKLINTTLDAWHAAAAKADFENYFKPMTDDAIFIGTDATENWIKKDFMVWSKPYFDKGKAWSFTSLERHIYFDTSGQTAWFDELLNTQMKICRGSGLLIKSDNEWKIKHYVLSMTFPNEMVDSVVVLKAPIEDALIDKLRK